MILVRPGQGGGCVVYFISRNAVGDSSGEPETILWELLPYYMCFMSLATEGSVLLHQLEAVSIRHDIYNS